MFVNLLRESSVQNLNKPFVCKLGEANGSLVRKFKLLPKYCAVLASQIITVLLQKPMGSKQIHSILHPEIRTKTCPTTSCLKPCVLLKSSDAKITEPQPPHTTPHTMQMLIEQANFQVNSQDSCTKKIQQFSNPGQR